MDAEANAAPIDSLDVTVPEALAGARLDRALSTLASSSRRLARLAIGEGRVWLGSRRVKIFTREVRAGQRLRCLPAGMAHPKDTENGGEVAARPNLRAPAGGTNGPVPKLQVVHIDPWVVVVNKPAGLLSEPDRFGAPSAEGLLPALLAARGEPNEVWLVHRLDAGTSGLLLFARRRSAARRLFAAFAAREVDKTYHAVVAGRFDKTCRVNAPLQRLAGTRQGVHPDGKPATTHFAPLCAGAAYSLVQARPTTGRTHQIRVHAAHLQHPIVGDALYGGPRYVQVVQAGTSPGADLGFAATKAITRPLLHAYALKLAHPSEQGHPPLDLTLAAPADFAFATPLPAIA